MLHRRSQLVFAFSAALVVAILPGRAEAQYRLTRETIQPHDSASVAVLRVMRDDLTKLRLAQDAHFAQHGSYALELADLAGYRPASDGAIVLTYVGPEGWRAEATHPALRGVERLSVVRENDAAPAAMPAGTSSPRG